ncbi:MAG: TAXI family TRAP transporter solute-binding subunit [Salinivirgaceae bacterium]|nr:TAXI family TRAP transporter solute-binding subunit [Salinivirgaceae bacterium]
MRQVILLVSIIVISVTVSYGQKIATGIKGISTYYALAHDINIFNEQLTIIETTGSNENYDTLYQNTNDICYAFMQSDVYLSNSIKHPLNAVKVVVPLYNEELHLIVRNNGSINNLKDLNKDKYKVAIGTKNSGTNTTLKLLIDKLNLKFKMVEVNYQNGFDQLLDNKIDALFYIGGAPVQSFANFPPTIKEIIKLLPIEIKNDELSKLYFTTTIPKGTYPWVVEEITTIGVKAIIATNIEKTNCDVIILTTLLLEKLDDFKNTPDFFHSKWQEVDPYTDNYLVPNYCDDVKPLLKK